MRVKRCNISNLAINSYFRHVIGYRRTRSQHIKYECKMCKTFACMSHMCHIHTFYHEKLSNKKTI